MKTVNGNNKEERLINKAKKYLGLDLIWTSNKYTKIAPNQTISDNLILVAPSAVKILNTKYGEKLLIEPINAKEDFQIWEQPWKAIKAYNGAGGDAGLIVNLSDANIQKLVDSGLLDGADDIFKLNTLDTKTYYFSTKSWL